MRIFLDTEFIEDGRTIDLLSIGMVREDGELFYAEPAEVDRSKASPWVKQHVLPNLMGPVMSRADIARNLVTFCGPEPEFWAWYADYDWVALCQLFGTMMELPEGWPMYCRDFKQTSDEQGLKIVQDESSIHNALYDAQWLANTFMERWVRGDRRMLDTPKPMPPIPTGVVAVCDECGALVQKPGRHKRWHKYGLSTLPNGPAVSWTEIQPLDTPPVPRRT